MFRMSYVWVLPERSWSLRPARWVRSGWQLSGILKLLSGTAFRVTSGVDTALTGTSDNGRANQILGDAYLPNKNKDGWLNINAFAVPTQATGICSACQD